MTLKLEQNKRVKMFILKDNGDIYRRSKNLESWEKCIESVMLLLIQLKNNCEESEKKIKVH